MDKFILITLFSCLMIMSPASAFDFPHTIVNIDYTGNLTNLSEMQDTNILTPTNNYVLTWDSATSKWIAKSVGSAGDTNETTRFNTLVGNCSANQLVFGIDSNGNKVCIDDQGQSYTHLTNFTDDITWTTNFNSTFDSRDSDTIRTNGTGISLTGDVFSILLSYFTDRFLQLTGGTMTGVLNMGDNNINNVNNINVTNHTYVNKLHSYNGNSINIQPTSDTDDYFSFKTPSHRPTIKREGGKFIYFESSNVYDVGVSFRKDDTYSGTLAYAKDDNIFKMLGKASPIALIPNSEYLNYILFETYNDQPQISVFNGTKLLINDSVELSSTAPDLTLHNTNHTNTDYGRESELIFKGEQSGGEETTLGKIQVAHDGTADDQKGIMSFKVNDGDDADAPGTAMTILANGNVGIGNLNPLSKLQVAGDIHLQNDTDKLYFGQAKDVSIEMNATSFNILDEVGSIPFYFKSFLKYVFDSDVEVSGNVTATYLKGDGSELTGLAGGGDITAVNTNGVYLTGGSDSGIVSLLLNETILNATIDLRAGDNATWSESLANTLYADISVVDTDTTYTAGNGLSVSSEVFSVAGNTALTQDADGLSVTADGIGDTQLAYNTGQHLTTTSNPQFNNITGLNCLTFSNGATMCGI